MDLVLIKSKHSIFSRPMTNCTVIQLSWVIGWCENSQVINLEIFSISAIHPSNITCRQHCQKNAIYLNYGQCRNWSLWSKSQDISASVCVCVCVCVWVGVLLTACFCHPPGPVIHSYNQWEDSYLQEGPSTWPSHGDAHSGSQDAPWWCLVVFGRQKRHIEVWLDSKASILSLNFRKTLYQVYVETLIMVN